MNYLRYQLCDFIWYCTDKRRTVMYDRFTENRNMYEHNFSDYSSWYQSIRFSRGFDG